MARSRSAIRVTDTLEREADANASHTSAPHAHGSEPAIANYYRADNLKEAIRRAVFHEMTHHWEHADAGTSAVSHDWRAARAGAAGTPEPVDVQLKPGDPTTRGMSIKALLGDFLWRYVGRLYPSTPATEVYTEGVERFASGSGMAELVAIDPEQFYLVLGTLK